MKLIEMKIRIIIIMLNNNYFFGTNVFLIYFLNNLITFFLYIYKCASHTFESIALASESVDIHVD